MLAPLAFLPLFSLKSLKKNKSNSIEYSRMAFTTTQRLDNALLRNLTFRTPLNVPISSQYTLYANGQGQTYWSNSVSPADLSTVYSTLSTSVYALGSTTTSSVTALTNSITLVATNLTNFSTSMSTSVGQLLINDSNLSNSVLSLSNNLTNLAYSNFIQINNIYNSTIFYVGSTLSNYSNLSSFYGETSNLLGVISSAVSSLSTVIGTQNTSTYNVLTSNYQFYTNQRFLTLDVYLSTTFSSIYTTYDTIFSTQSSFAGVTNEMLSSSSNIQSTLFGFSTIDGDLFSSTFNLYLYPISSIVSTHDVRISSLEALSTGLSTVIAPYVTSTLSTSQGLQNVDIQSSVSSLSYLYSSLTASTTQARLLFNAFSSYVISTFTTNMNEISILETQVSTLTYEFSVLTTSSILASIYESFVNLEIYTSSVIVADNIAFTSSLVSSANSTISGTAEEYFNFYVSTIYASTLSTLVPSTQAYYSTLTSTTLNYALSTATSSMYGISLESLSTYTGITSTLTTSIISSSANQLDSSIQSYLVIPTTSTNAAYSTIFFSSLSTMLSTGYGQLGVQSTMFSSVYSFYSTALSTIFISSLNQIVFMSTSTGLNNSTTTGQLSTNSTLFGRQLSTQSGQFTSSLNGQGSQFNVAMNSSVTAITAQTTVAATSTLTTIQNSTIQTYNTFVAGLNNAISSATFSTLYTEQVLDLTGTTSNAIMDMAGYRNFNINVYNLSSTGALYKLSYNQNSLVGLNYRTGFIFVNVSTVGQTYTSNGSQLRFDAYQWGLPTTVFGSIYPYISNADYLLQYQYVIQNNFLYTNLMNVYPRIRISTATFSSIGVNSLTSDGTIPYTNAFWRGAPIQVSWSQYSFFPSSLGAPPFNPQIIVDMSVGGNVVAEFGPYSFFGPSSVTVTAPYLTGVQSSNVLGTQMRVYIAGAPTQAVTSSFFTIMPTYDQVQLLQPVLPLTGYVGGTELVLQTDLGGYPLYNTTTSMSATSGQISYDNTSNFIPQHINNGLLNQVGASGYDNVSLTYSTIVASVPLAGLNLEPEGLVRWSTTRTANVTQISTTTSVSFINTIFAADWEATAYATPAFGFKSNAYVCASPNAGRYMSFGLDPSPAGKVVDQFQYCWLFNFSEVRIYTFGLLRTLGIAYLTTNRYAINFNGSRVQFLINGIEQYSEARSIGAPLLFGASFSTDNSQLNNVVYSPILAPTGIVREATPEIGSTTYFVNFGSNGNNYFSNVSTLRRYGIDTFFRFSRLSTSIQFLASSVQLSSGTASVWRIDSGTPNTSNTFSNGTIYMNYNYSYPTRISSSAFYTESNFCAPSVGTPDANVTVNMNSVNLSSNVIPVSTLLYYNLLGTPIAGTQTNNMRIRATVISGSSNYISTFITNGSSNVQVFRV